MVLPKSPQCQNHSRCQERIHFDEDEKLVINRAWHNRSSFQRSNEEIKKKTPAVASTAMKQETMKPHRAGPQHLHQLQQTSRLSLERLKASALG